MNKIKLSPVNVSGKEIEYLRLAIERKELSNFGENLEKFEQQLEVFFSKPSKIALLNSGTAAVHLALVNLGVKQNDEVICQSFTFCASAYPILYQGAIPVFVDSEIDTWNMCPIFLEKAIKDRISLGRTPKAIIITHVYGMPAKLDEIVEVSNRYNIPLIEDAAEALGSFYKDQKCGTFGNFGIISFNGNKIITTSGGGALICNTKQQRKKTLFLAAQAKDDTPFYQHSEVGYNYTMSNIIASVGRAQIEQLDNMIYSRRGVHLFYKNVFKDINEVIVFEETKSYYYSNHWLTCILINDNETGFNSEDLRKELLNHSIEARPLWKPLHTQPIFKDFPFYGNKISESLFEKGLCLPSGSNLNSENKAIITKTILNYFNC